MYCTLLLSAGDLDSGRGLCDGQAGQEDPALFVSSLHDDLNITSRRVSIIIIMIVCLSVCLCFVAIINVDTVPWELLSFEEVKRGQESSEVSWDKSGVNFFTD